MGFYTGIYRKKPFYKKWWFWTIIIILLLYLGLSGDNYEKLGIGTAENASSDAGGEAAIPDLMVIEHSTRNDDVATYIVGTVQNNSDRKYDHVKIEVSLFDASGKPIGTLAENISGLEPNGMREFEVMSLEDFDTYQIKNVIGFELPSKISKFLSTLDSSQNVSGDGTTPDLELIEHSVREGDLASCIVGTVQNNTEKRFLYVQIEFELYNADGTEAGNALADTSELGPNGTWNFEAEALGGFNTYKIKNITGFGLPPKLTKLLEKWS